MVFAMHAIIRKRELARWSPCSGLLCPVQLDGALAMRPPCMLKFIVISIEDLAVAVMLQACSSRAGCAPCAAQQAHCAQQHAQQQQHSRMRNWTPQSTGGAARRAAAAASATRGSSSGAALAPPLLEQRYCSTSLSKDKLTEERREYYTKMGAGIRALQQDLPALLERQPSMEVFCEGVVFEDNLSPRLGLPSSSCVGKEAYGRLMWSLRFHRTLFFCKSRVDLHKMWEKEPGVVCVRWTAAASPRLLDGLLATSSTAMSLDGVSEFHFDEHVPLIIKHSVDCVSYSGPRVAQPLLARYAARQQRAMVPGLAGGSFDDC